MFFLFETRPDDQTDPSQFTNHWTCFRVEMTDINTVTMDVSHLVGPGDDWEHLYTSTEKDFDENIILQAPVVPGFRRGSKELGIPTANLDMDVLGKTGSALQTGIYFGWAKLKGNIYECVVSVGWNPFYKNEKKTVEAHLLEKLDDFYGEELVVVLCGYLRQECSFNGVEELISCINYDIAKTRVHNQKNDMKEMNDNFLQNK